MTFLSTIRFRKAPPILKNPRGCPLTRNRTSVWEPGLAARQVAEFAIPMTFLKFARGAEEEADYLGTQYMYRTGYDPAAMITMFEKLQAQQKSSPGKVSGLFSSHPATASRIEKTKETIVTVLPERDEYALTTSKFDRIKDRLTVAENRIPARDDDRPSLRRRTRRPNVSGKEPAEDDRPVLRRRDGSHDF